MGHDDLNDAASKMAGIMGPAAYGDGSSIVPKKKPTKKPVKPKKPKPRPKPRPKPKKPPKAKVLTPPKAKIPPKGRKTHSGSITQLGKGTRSQLEAIGYIDKPK